MSLESIDRVPQLSLSFAGLKRPWAGGTALWLASTATLGLLPRRPAGARRELAGWSGRTA